MSREEHHYVSYLLRLWQIRSGGKLVWRASVQRRGTRERMGFASPEALFTYLRQQAGVVLDSDGDRDESDLRLKPSATKGKAP